MKMGMKEEKNTESRGKEEEIRVTEEIYLRKS